MIMSAPFSADIKSQLVLVNNPGVNLVHFVFSRADEVANQRKALAFAPSPQRFNVNEYHREEGWQPGKQLNMISREPPT